MASSRRNGADAIVTFLKRKPPELAEDPAVTSVPLPFTKPRLANTARQPDARRTHSDAPYSVSIPDVTGVPEENKEVWSEIAVFNW